PAPLPVLLPPPSTPPLFPYTTLFRSTIDQFHRKQNLAFALGLDVDVELYRIAVIGLLFDLHRDVDLGSRGGRAADQRRRRVGALDRKSTRLNSSHVKISYAVFCLKKK